MEKECKGCDVKLPKDEYTGFCQSCYVMEKTPTPTTRDEARQYAIDWQGWVSQKNLSYGELAKWGEIFTELAEKFGLVDEFKENGII